MTDGEKEEALRSLAAHYGIPLFMEMVDKVVDRVAQSVMTVPLNDDPQKASLALYAARMKAEGANAVKMALTNHIQSLKQKGIKR